jgi:mannose-1-phosphate guanylyltransferase / mannose-6-phosphate isomerase
MAHICPVVMAGGSGTRLWPLSRSAYPKQFLALDGTVSLLQQSVQRLMAIAPGQTGAPLVVGNEEHRFLLVDQLREMGQEPSALVLEPIGRNTAPALTLAALQAQRGGEDPVLVVAPADQTVTDLPAFVAALRQATQAAAEGAVVILGIQPVRPETGFGYIEADTTGSAAAGPRPVRRFVEKPDAATAQGYVDAGNFYWNSGLFVLRASVWLKALGQHRPDILSACQAAFAQCTTDGVFVRPDKAAFAAIPAESVDYAVMEKLPGSGGTPLLMVPLDAGWNDLGAWDAVWQVTGKDGDGNATQGDVLMADTRNTLVQATSRLVGVIGVDDLVVVETPDAVLVSDRSRSQDVKKIVGQLGQTRRAEQNLHRKVHRPWGWYDSIDQGPRFQVKRIMVKPGASLSLQMHHHRAEHWIVVSGTAEVTCGDRKLLLSENQSTYIPLGEVHRLANPGKVPLEIIEVQSGSYLGEDDIVRFEDTYGRQ